MLYSLGHLLAWWCTMPRRKKLQSRRNCSTASKLLWMCYRVLKIMVCSTWLRRKVTDWIELLGKETLWIDSLLKSENIAKFPRVLCCTNTYNSKSILGSQLSGSHMMIVMIDDRHHCHHHHHHHWHIKVSWSLPVDIGLTGLAGVATHFGRSLKLSNVGPG